MTIRRALFAACVAGLYLVAWWLVQGATSPLHDIFTRHPEIGNFLTRLSMPAILVGMVASGNVHQPSTVVTFIAVCVQWFVVGWLVSVAGSWILARRAGAS